MYSEYLYNYETLCNYYSRKKISVLQNPRQNTFFQVTPRDLHSNHFLPFSLQFPTHACSPKQGVIILPGFVTCLLYK